MKNLVLLVADADQNTESHVRQITAAIGPHEVVSFHRSEEARSWGRHNRFDIGFISCEGNGRAGMELATALREHNPRALFIMLADAAHEPMLVDAVRDGAFDFLVKPVTLLQLEEALRRAIDHYLLPGMKVHFNAALDRWYRDVELLGVSAKMQAVREKVEVFSQSSAPVLVTGETGVGKEVVARMIHLLSARAGRPFVTVACGTYAETLFESELFGHERGAFTGADQPRAGRLEEVEQGTLLLDEICETPLPLQVKLLRVLQERVFERVGGNRGIGMHARVISATNRDVEEEIRHHRFREDLFYRISALRLHIPPLRERPEDIRFLALRILKRAAVTASRQVTGIANRAMRRIMDYAWPGNVRQLEGAIESAVLISEGEELEERHFSEELFRSPSSAKEASRLSSPPGVPLEQEVRQLELRRVREALAAAGGNQSQAARILGITRGQLFYRMKKFGIRVK